MIGYIYHVVDKTTEEIVKVGSTVRALEVRWREYDKVKYSNHFLRLVKAVENDSEDFSWHLVASEHMEILRANTFRKGPLSNQFSPLDQKYFGFNQDFTVLAGETARDRKLGIHNPNFDRISAARKGGEVMGPITGRRHVESGHLDRIRELPSRLKNLRPILLKHNAANGVATLGSVKFWKANPERATRRSKFAQHVRWHINAKRLPKAPCEFCEEKL